MKINIRNAKPLLFVQKTAKKERGRILSRVKSVNAILFKIEKSPKNRALFMWVFAFHIKRLRGLVNIPVN